MKYPSVVALRNEIFAYNKDLDDTYFSTINTVFGLFIEIKNVDFVKKGKDYYL